MPLFNTPYTLFENRLDQLCNLWLLFIFLHVVHKGNCQIECATVQKPLIRSAYVKYGIIITIIYTYMYIYICAQRIESYYLEHLKAESNSTERGIDASFTFFLKKFTAYKGVKIHASY
jgi:hypothetical protein